MLTKQFCLNWALQLYNKWALTFGQLYVRPYPFPHSPLKPIYSSTKEVRGSLILPTCKIWLLQTFGAANWYFTLANIANSATCWCWEAALMGGQKQKKIPSYYAECLEQGHKSTHKVYSLDHTLVWESWFVGLVKLKKPWMLSICCYSSGWYCWMCVSMFSVFPFTSPITMEQRRHNILVHNFLCIVVLAGQTQVGHSTFLSTCCSQCEAKSFLAQFTLLILSGPLSLYGPLCSTKLFELKESLLSQLWQKQNKSNPSNPPRQPHLPALKYSLKTCCIQIRSWIACKT